MSRIECVCECDVKLQSYIANCRFLRMETGIWIGVTYDTDGEIGYIVDSCPFDYCTKEPIDISLKTSRDKPTVCIQPKWCLVRWMWARTQSYSDYLKMQGVLEHLKYFSTCLPTLFVFSYAWNYCSVQTPCSISKLLSNANPVAALLHCYTLFMLSYSKLLRFTISALQFNFLRYPDGSDELVWLYDANVRYFNPEHTARFIAAVVILTAGRLFILFWFSLANGFLTAQIMKWKKKHNGFMNAYPPLHSLQSIVTGWDYFSFLSLLTTS